MAVPTQMSFQRSLGLDKTIIDIFGPPKLLAIQQTPRNKCFQRDLGFLTSTLIFYIIILAFSLLASRLYHPGHYYWAKYADNKI